MAWREYLNRSFDVFKSRSVALTRMDPLGTSQKVQMTMATLRSPDDLRSFALGADSDIGGHSTAHLDLDADGKGRFSGSLSSKVPQGLKLGGSEINRTGYAGFRTKSRPSIFGIQTWDTSLHQFLKLRLRNSGDSMRYFVNLQTDGPVQSDLFQHRLILGEVGKWEDVLVAFDHFTLINSGDLSETQISMMREKIRTVGISVLGPAEGDYELGIESFEAVNSNDAELLLQQDEKVAERLTAGTTVDSRTVVEIPAGDPTALDICSQLVARIERPPPGTITVER
ncbi:hypothetical protein E5Q_06094 [Mixia osmundae IAM 14324]|uniref:NADH:ubiquinone oxidoreductase intermediate-associated protein 30 domain-containing protein n=1 Tax=Mixia osmundae (strain CBS 9802 / IAM 14324 / JCM 22182 / KY 12970) TaxID=764103 RepID=G7E9S7_MIXOS|nr:hypothetical protein E5Q_06094 [Mixia osmundae IAM 14324]